MCVHYEYVAEPARNILKQLLHMFESVLISRNIRLPSVYIDVDFTLTLMHMLKQCQLLLIDAMF